LREGWNEVHLELRCHTPDDFRGLHCSQVADKLAKARRTDGYLREILANHTSPNVLSGELALKQQTHVSKNMLYRYIEYLEEQGESMRKDESPAIADKNKISYVEIDTISRKTINIKQLVLLIKPIKWSP
jgi:IS30 family transposase